MLYFNTNVGATLTGLQVAQLGPAQSRFRNCSGTGRGGMSRTVRRRVTATVGEVTTSSSRMGFTPIKRTHLKRP